MAAKSSPSRRTTKKSESDSALSYDEFKTHEGRRYTGMKVGRSHKWYYDKGEWKEKKITPDLSQIGSLARASSSSYTMDSVIEWTEPPAMEGGSPEPAVRAIAPDLWVAYRCHNPEFPGWSSGASIDHQGFVEYYALIRFVEVQD